MVGPQQPTLLSINDTKAGMQGLDKEKINAIIHEASRGSSFYEFQQKRQEKIDQQVAYLRSKAAALTELDIKRAENEAEAKVKELREIGKDLAHLICHLDMDMFYAAVEIRDQPDLADKPVAVGSLGMIATSNYVARAYGVRAGMAGFIGKKLCPQLQLIRPNFSKYKEASRKVMAIIEEYDPNMRSGSLDEAYFDLTNYVIEEYTATNPELDVYINNSDGYVMFRPEVWSLAEQTLSEIRGRITEETKLTCSAGLTHNSMLSKICSDLKKPNNQYILASTSPEVVEKFVRETRVRKVPGIGPVSDQLLAGLEIITCQDLFNKRGVIASIYNPASIEYYLRVSMGISSTTIEPHDKRERKSLGAETSFKAIRNDKLWQILRSLAQEVSDDLIKRNLAGRVIVLRIKWETFRSCVRNRTVSSPTNNCELIFNTVSDLLKHELMIVPDLKIRLLGVRVAGFIGENCSASTSSTSDTSTSHDSTHAGSLFPFLNKTIKDSIIWKITYDSGEIETNAEPTNIAIYEDEETVSSAHVCLTCQSFFSSEQDLSNHMMQEAHSGEPDTLMDIF